MFGEVMLPLIAKRRDFSVSVSGAVLLMIIMLNYVAASSCRMKNF